MPGSENCSELHVSDNLSAGSAVQLLSADPEKFNRFKDFEKVKQF
jgi:hypothetical protein